MSRTAFSSDLGSPSLPRVASAWDHQPASGLPRLFAIVSDLVVIMSREGEILLVNPAWQETLGWSQEELIGRTIWEFVNPEDRGSSGALRVGGDAANFTNRFRHKDGSWRWLLWSGRSDGDFWYAVAKDVTDNAQGGARVALFEKRARREAAERVQAERELREAIREQQLKVLYQPVASAIDGTLIGCEALVRWRHPREGLVLPERFIPLAEATGLIVELGEQVLMEACRQAGQWRRSGSDFTVSVNVSRRQLLEPGFVELVRSALKVGGVPGQMMCLEVTETAAPAQHPRIVEVLREVRRLGIRIALDDFGAGHSTFTNLRELAIDTIKVDRSFVAGVNESDDDRGIVAAMLALSRELGLTAVAEGVETHTQLSCLRALGCKLAQGFLFGPALPPDELLTGTFSHRRLPGIGDQFAMRLPA